MEGAIDVAPISQAGYKEVTRLVLCKSLTDSPLDVF